MAFLTGQSWRVLKSWTQAGAQNKDFAADSQTDLTRSLVPPPPELRLWHRLFYSLQNIAITELNYSVCAMIVPNRLKFASFSYFQVNLPKLTWLIFLSHSKYDTVTPPAFKYKSCKIRIIFKGAVSRFLLDLFKKLKRVVPSITWEKQYPSLYLAIETVFRCLLLRMARMDMDWNLKKVWLTFQVSMLRLLKITKIILLWLVLPWWYLFHNSRGVFCVW